MAVQLSDGLDGARCAGGLSHGDLWLRYFELGGMSTLNERFVELGGNHPVAYSEDQNGTAGKDDP